MKNIVILGSTGSIGTQALEVLEEQPAHFRARGLVAGSNVQLLIRQALAFRPAWVGITDQGKGKALRDALPPEIEVAVGEGEILAALKDPDYEICLAAISGIAGLKATIAAMEAGKDIALANKETLVAGGSLVTGLAREKGIHILPVDSEHSAIFQSLGSGRRRLKSILLTASGGPFRDWDEKDLAGVRPQDALKHPNWSMGQKITIDSATLANKALEIIEAHHLFHCPYPDIRVLVHRESIIHSMVEFEDTSVVGQLGYPSMKLPILYALTHPESLPAPWPSLDLAKIGTLHFEEPKPWFRALSLGIQAGMAGGTAPAIYNGANEAAVSMFLQGEIGFTEIWQRIESALNHVCPGPGHSFEEIAEADRLARQAVLERRQG